MRILAAPTESVAPDLRGGGEFSVSCLPPETAFHPVSAKKSVQPGHIDQRTARLRLHFSLVQVRGSPSCRRCIPARQRWSGRSEEGSPGDKRGRDRAAPRGHRAEPSRSPVSHRDEQARGSMNVRQPGSHVTEDAGRVAHRERAFLLYELPEVFPGTKSRRGSARR